MFYGLRMVWVRPLSPGHQEGTPLVHDGIMYFPGPSDVIEAIEWAIDYRARFNIRVINLSLGHPVVEPAADDPLCQAVGRATARRAVNAIADDCFRLSPE